MNVKRWLLAAVGAFVVLTVADFVIHNLWLSEFYRAHAQWWRPATEMQSMMGLMFVSEAVLAVLLALIYTKGYEAQKGGAGQGFRFGVLMGLLLAVPSSLMKAFVYPYPGTLILNWLIGTLIEVALAGVVIGLLYRPSK